MSFVCCGAMAIAEELKAMLSAKRGEHELGALMCACGAAEGALQRGVLRGGREAVGELARPCPPVHGGGGTG